MNSKLLSCLFIFVFSIPVLAFSQKINYETKGFKDSSVVKRYQISVSYPQVIGFKDTRAQDKVNTIIQTEIKKISDDFIKQLVDWDLTDIPADFSSEFECNFTVSYSQDNIFSVAFEIYTYYAGAAHPYSYAYCMNMDLVRAKVIDFTLMFKDENSGLKKLSDYCFNELKKRNDTEDICTDDEWLKEGTKPDVKNYESLPIEPEGILVIFNAYQVACYAAGPQTVKIPYSELKDFINPKGPLSIFLK
ncbi:MAG TPA: DUF3298 and DUF4163 domain-containing protein [Ignavibacteria bacterium]